MSKKDRDMGMNPYPIYQNNSGMMMGGMPNMGMMPTNPAMMPVFGMPNMMPGVGMGMPNGIPMPAVSGMGNGIEAQLSAMNNQINNLEKRVTRLEGSAGNSGLKYNESNYYIV